MPANLFDLTGQLALVTGASKGLGQYFGRALAGAGADLIVTARNQADLQPFVEEIEALGRKAYPLSLDVRDHGSIEAVALAASKIGQVHILVNNAGCNVRKPASEVSWDDWNLVLDTNLRGSFFVAHPARHILFIQHCAPIIQSARSSACIATASPLKDSPLTPPPPLHCNSKPKTTTTSSPLPAA